MKPKEKPCKGTGKAKGFGCGRMQLERKYGLGRLCGCLGEWLFTSQEGLEVIEKTKLKAKKKVKANQKKKDRELKKKTTNWKNKLQTKVQEISRLIDYGLPCIARQIEAKQMHGGHVLSKGGNSECRFNLHNIHRQSAYSNTFKNDDDLMKEGVEREYGKEYLEFIKGLKGYDIPKYSNMEYYEFYKVACSVANEMRKDLRVYDWKGRIEKRNDINKRIGIYSQSQNHYKL